MKKVSSEISFSFRVNGLGDSGTVLDISPKGVVVGDEVANFVQERFGKLVTVASAVGEKKEKKPAAEEPKVEEPEAEEPVAEEPKVSKKK